jgi:ring-1,2-phenylacetyl-CoA epoxidase subunit PaaC
MAFDNAYESLADAVDDSRWAFGTGFSEPLSGVDTSVPSTVDGRELAAYCLMLGDDALIMSHRLQQWCTRSPELEDEVAVANIGLDLLGQARLLFARAGKADGTQRGEDDYAYLRDERDFRNVRLVERDCADFAELIVTVLVFATWRLALFQRLTESADPVLAAIAVKGVKELTYHRDYAAQWAVRLGDGTQLSHQKMIDATTLVWPDVAELFAPHDVERRLPAVAAAAAETRAEFDEVLGEAFGAATLPVPETVARSGVSGRSGRDGVHSESMGYVLAELQSVARANPGATW